jgi:hypothetical protein
LYHLLQFKLQGLQNKRKNHACAEMPSYSTLPYDNTKLQHAVEPRNPAVKSALRKMLLAQDQHANAAARGEYDIKKVARSK